MNFMDGHCFKLWFSFLAIMAISDRSISQIDPLATKETKALYQHLFKLRAKGVLFGHQDAMAYGLNADKSRWIGGNNTSDVKTITGEHPAIIGQDLGHLELDHTVNLDSVPFQHIREIAIQTYLNGGINTISWHLNNPLDLNKTAWDKMDSTIAKLLIEKKQWQHYEQLLDKLSSFFKSIKAPNGKMVPIIFRPYHEHTGSWFWWGAGHCTTDQYKLFWQKTVDYLVKKKNVHNLLFAYSTDNFRSEAHYLERYPGDQYVDLFGFDTYHRNAPVSDSNFIANAKRMVGTIKKLGEERHKLYAITETGLERVSEPDWWTRVLYPIIQNTGLSYVLVWRNGRPDHYYAPYPGSDSEADFKKFFNLPGTLFEKELKHLYEK